MDIRRIFRSCRRDVLLLLLFGGMLISLSFTEFIASLRPAVSFQELLEGREIREGSHVAGNVVCAFDYFASKSSYTRYKDGSRSGDKKSGNYYLIPGSSMEFMGLKSRQADVNALNRLSKETFDYLADGPEPKTEIFMQGIVKAMNEEVAEYYYDYMEELLGYSREDLQAHGEPLLVEYVNFRAVQIVFAAGIVMLFLAVWLLIRRYRRDAAFALSY